MTSDTANVNQYLVFVMDGENYAIPIEHIREVLIVPKITKVPQMPEFMRGVINLRGSAIPLLDLRLKFGLGETSITAETVIIVVDIPSGDGENEKESLYLGLYADVVKKVIALGKDSIEPPPKIGTKIRTDFITGVGKIDGDFVVILDIRAVLTVRDLEAIETVQDAQLA